MKDLRDTSEFWNNESTYYMDGLGQDVTAVTEKTVPWYQKLIDVYGAVQAQKTSQKYQEMLMKENLERQRRNLPPMSMTEFQASVPAARVDVGLSPQTRNMLIAGGIGLLGILAFTMLRPKRGR